ncbi:GntR family transcriptional regulator [Neobacillus notoginsengisoli]|uniref:GntR family transcriptional regulator n=1 Tax=Neobacillus notoginsengisoli TaxID=1578198 RepID=A0A417YPZ9_9BACI|nr:GntR family transcriptional regulator [Neobacillus notoginsengisoli]RHW35749.1 GntR family transcriptional regulator [Neobacillus notoginsengisoli]
MIQDKQESSLYSLVKKSISEKIQSGLYKVGDKLPTEMELCAEYNVSRTTVRLALDQLALEGRIVKVQGSGTFVSKPKISQSLSTAGKGFVDQIIEQGYLPNIEILDLRVIPADKSLSKKLKIKENDPVNRLERIRYVNDEPMQYEIAFIPWHFAPGLINDAEDCKNSLFKLLQLKYNVKIKKTLEEIEPILADENVSKQLNISRSTPIFSLETITYNDNDDPIEYSEAVFRGDRYKFTIERLYG